MGSASVISVEEQLRESGMRLLNSASSVDELLIFLDRAEELLCSIEQAPPISVKEALFPMMKALKADTLLKHSDVDVQVSVASCIHEITRITAPKEPYNDDLMKEIFKLTVSALENLSQPSTRCYKKAASIIYTIARVRSFLVMVDLECDTLIVDMFKHFLKHARLNHSEDVLWAMEQIMTIVLDESEYISFKLLCPLLASVRKENQNVAPVSWELGNRVISKCASKLRPFVGEAVESMDADVDDFAPIVASLCQSSIVSREQNHAKDSKEPAVEVTITLQEFGSGSDPVPKSTSDDIPGQMPKDDATSNSDSNVSRKSGLEAVVATGRKRGRRPNSMLNPEEGYDEYWTNREKTSAKIPRRRNSHFPGVNGTRSKIPAAEKSNLPSNIDADQVAKLEVNGNGDRNSWLVPSLLQQKLGDNASERRSRNKDKESKLQAKQQTSSRKRRKYPMDNLEGGMLTTDASLADKEISDAAANNKIEEKAPLISKVFFEDECRSEGTSHMSKLQAKKQNSLRKRGKAESYNVDSRLQIEDASMFDTEISELPTNKMRLLVGNKVSSEGQYRSKKMHKTSNLQGKKQSTERKRKRAAAVNLESDNQDTNSMDKVFSGPATNKIVEKTILRNKVSCGDECHSEGTPTTNRSLKRKANKEEESGQRYSVEDIVDRRIRVWWPMDKKYYEGFVQSYDYKKKRYLVVYTDGDVERLNLPKKRWKFVDEENTHTPPRKRQDTEATECHDKQHSHGQISNLRRNTSKSINYTNPYQLVKRSGASSSALRLEADDGSVGRQPPIVVKVEDYINSEEDSEATISETETTISETTL